MAAIVLVIVAWAPFLPWAVGSITRYEDAVKLASVLSVAVLVGGVFWTATPRSATAGDTSAADTTAADTTAGDSTA